MGHLIVTILPLALGAAVSPTLLTLTVLILTAKQRAGARALVFALGAGLVLLGLGLVEMYVLRGVAASRGPTSPIFFWIDLGFGVLLVALALRSLLAKPKTKKDRKPMGSDWGLDKYFVLGVAGMATNASTLVIYVPLAKEISRAQISGLLQIVVLVAANLLIMAPVLIPLGIRVFLPGPSTRILGALDVWVTKNGRRLGGVLILAVGALLVYRGLRGL